MLDLRCLARVLQLCVVLSLVFFFHLEVEKKAVVREGPRGKDVHFQENFRQDVPKMIFALGLKERAGDRDSEGRIFTGRCEKEVGAE